jgi:hypothetical protein
VLLPANKREYVSGIPKRRNNIKKPRNPIPTRTFFDSLSAKGLAGDIEPHFDIVVTLTYHYACA